jgi:ubiquinone/menaquinone biosynthesis C-methylase UbiE
MDIHSIYKLFGSYFRKNRMKTFEDYFKPSDARDVSDVGGGQFNWRFDTAQPRVTILNISRPHDWDDSNEQFSLIMGDATKLDYSDNSFDIAYSNSVIEQAPLKTRESLPKKSDAEEQA